MNDGCLQHDTYEWMMDPRNATSPRRQGRVQLDDNRFKRTPA